MYDPASDTIVAPATPAGRGGIGVLRLSGPRAGEIAGKMMSSLPAPRQATLMWFLDHNGQQIDRGIALYFPSPASYTGEHVVELQAHGGPVVLDLLLEAATAYGARVAEPGEFTRRAFLNGKIDLAQSEAVVDLINSQTRTAARAAARSLSGRFSDDVHSLIQAVTSLRIYVEAAIDFPEEEVDFLADVEIRTRLDDVESQLATLRRAARDGQRLRDGVTLVLAGRPNAGKSSVLNRLAGSDVAIVTDRPGTTRDVLREDIELDGIPLRIVDTAGLRDSDDPIEMEGVRRARAAMQSADLLLHVVDMTGPNPQATDLPDLPLLTVLNKKDLVTNPSSDATDTCVPVSALTGAGFDDLTRAIKRAVGAETVAEGNVIARTRHLDALDRAAEHVELGRRALEVEAAGEIMAEELRQAQNVLGEITGRITSDDLLGHIFSSFCIGK
ncbi:MAG: tRNA uridine-5-carboxymethylaminomethyl(34) synthesis GTPase MnmE [Pseudomonadota bacterium]